MWLKWVSVVLYPIQVAYKGVKKLRLALLHGPGHPGNILGILFARGATADTEFAESQNPRAEISSRLMNLPKSSSRWWEGWPPAQTKLLIPHRVDARRSEKVQLVFVYVSLDVH